MKEKDIVGNKMIEFLMLPERSRVSVVTPLEGSERFLKIKGLRCLHFLFFDNFKRPILKE